MSERIVGCMRVCVCGVCVCVDCVMRISHAFFLWYQVTESKKKLFVDKIDEFGPNGEPLYKVCVRV